MHDATGERLGQLNGIDLYPVLCEKLSNGRSDLNVAQEIIKGGAKIIQLRDKESSKKVIFEKARALRKLTLENRVLLIINDHIDIALSVDADGVHLGRDDFPLKEARKLLPGKILGASSHSLEQALEAEACGADYVNIGPIFPTATKEKAPEFIGPAAIGRIAPSLSVPFTVMGGIKMENIGEVLAQGARRIAVVTAVTQADDIALAVKNLRDRIISFR